MGRIEELVHQMVDKGLLENKEGPRTYLGASSLGVQCARQLWYSYHSPKRNIDAKLMRVFKVGHYLEPMVVDMLKGAGFTVYDTMPNGDQFGFEDGKIAGHCDGVIIIEGEPYLLEIKTAKDTTFKAFKKDGFTSNDKYRVQVHVYMHKFKLKKCLAAIINKNTQEMYYEVIEYDQVIAEHYLNRGHEIANSTVEPEREFKTKMSFGCKWCDHYEECWNK